MIQDLKRKIVQAVYDAKEGHIASAFSILDILWVLYKEILRPEDRFILSKGHASLALYAILGLDMRDFGKYNSFLGGHPDRRKAPGVVASTGSLGHGLPIAVGMALARKIKGSMGRVFCLVGDGECNEGAIWEACLLATHHKLNNLWLIVDSNHSSDRAVRLENMIQKFQSFGFGVEQIDGHDQSAIANSLKYPIWRQDAPHAVIAETTKGNGCERRRESEWHHKIPNEIDLSEILEELS